jgi:transcriptional regulator with XRE-family HTH domain
MAFTPDPVLASHIAWRRKALRLTQSQVAERLGVHRDLISAWETAAQSPRHSELQALARVLGLDTAADLENVERVFHDAA